MGVHALIYSRSPFQSVPVRVMVGVYSKDSYSLTQNKIEWTRKSAQRMKLSQLVEDGIKRNSKDETKSDNQGQALERTWATLISTELASKEHQHRELDFSQECDDKILEMAKACKEQQLFQATPLRQAKTIDFRWIKCPRKMKKWVTLKADETSFPHADLELLTYLASKGIDFELADKYKKMRHSCGIVST